MAQTLIRAGGGSGVSRHKRCRVLYLPFHYYALMTYILCSSLSLLPTVHCRGAARADDDLSSLEQKQMIWHEQQNQAGQMTVAAATTATTARTPTLTTSTAATFSSSFKPTAAFVQYVSNMSLHKPGHSGEFAQYDCRIKGVHNNPGNAVQVL